MNEKKEHILSLGQIEINAAELSQELSPDNLPVLPTRDFVMFPGITFPISLGRESSIATAEYAAEHHSPIAILCQKDPNIDLPDIPGDVYQYGVVAMVIKVLEIPDGPKTAILHALKTIRVTGPGSVPGTVNVQFVEEQKAADDDNEFVALAQIIRQTSLNILNKTIDGPNDLSVNLENIENPEVIVNLVATHTPASPLFKQALLATADIKKRGFKLLDELTKNEAMVELAHEIHQRTKQSLTENQRNAFLQQQMEAIRQELYGDDDDAGAFRKRAEDVNFPEDVRKTFMHEVDKLSRLNPQSPDYSVQYSYLELLLELPWNKPDILNCDLLHAEATLDADHYGLEKVKERIVEQLAVMMHNPSGKSPIICLVGPPGVGKTSLGQSVARAMGRKYQRVSLGGVHDEAEIRGHRRTYIGAMPGRIIDAMRRASSSNPLILLDEIDKVGADSKSDPTAALLEVLDPEQNCHFHDNYVDVDYDLSNVLFIATANTLSTLSRPLLDRMEVIDISGYLREEKIEIATRHIVPRVLVENGFKKSEITFSPEALGVIIDNYTAESGVRQLEKQIASVIRKLVVRKMKHLRIVRTVKPEHVRAFLGVETRSRESYEGNRYAGVVTGLAWTAAGGEILYIESSLARSKAEKLTVTGNLGDVMKESAVIALQYVKAHADKLGLDPDIFERYAVHIHVPEGAIPKDGPSAGITMVTSLASSFTRRKVRERTAMTGEMTLRGKVLPVGGIKEKILAAKRAGIDTIILSAENRKDVEEIAQRYIDGLTFIYVSDISEVLDAALLPELADDALPFGND